MFENKISNYVEIGPGKVLSGLNAKILAGRDGIISKSIDKFESISEVIGSI